MWNSFIFIRISSHFCEFRFFGLWLEHQYLSCGRSPTSGSTSNSNRLDRPCLTEGLFHGSPFMTYQLKDKQTKEKKSLFATKCWATFKCTCTNVYIDRRCSCCYYKGWFVSSWQLLSLNPSCLTQTGRPCSSAADNRWML